MTTLRVGTRGSDLALWQTRWVSDRLRAIHPSVAIEQVIIKTYGDVAKDQQFDRDWPVGWFVGAIERALASQQVDFAVHSYKDMPSAATPGLVIAAVPGREAVHDVLVTREPVELDHLSGEFRLGTSSPRRAAQFRRFCGVEVVPVRGNVPTRVAKVMKQQLDGVVLAAAGLNRLGIDVPNRIDLPVNRFVPSPAQGALAIQVREGGAEEELIRALDDESARRRVNAERAFLAAVGAGCHVPIGALAEVRGANVTLCGQLFSEDGKRLAEGELSGENPFEVGTQLAKRLMHDLGGAT